MLGRRADVLCAVLPLRRVAERSFGWLADAADRPRISNARSLPRSGSHGKDSHDPGEVRKGWDHATRHDPDLGPRFFTALEATIVDCAGLFGSFGASYARGAKAKVV